MTVTNRKPPGDDELVRSPLTRLQIPPATMIPIVLQKTSQPQEEERVFHEIQNDTPSTPRRSRVLGEARVHFLPSSPDGTFDDDYELETPSKKRRRLGVRAILDEPSSPPSTIGDLTPVSTRILRSSYERVARVEKDLPLCDAGPSQPQSVPLRSLPCRATTTRRALLLGPPGRANHHAPNLSAYKRQCQLLAS